MLPLLLCLCNSSWWKWASFSLWSFHLWLSDWDLHLNSSFVLLYVVAEYSVTCTDPRLKWSWQKWRRLPAAPISHCNNSAAIEAASLTWWQAEAEVAEAVDPEWRPSGWRHSGRWPTVRPRTTWPCRVLRRPPPDRVHLSPTTDPPHPNSNYVIIIVHSSYFLFNFNWISIIFHLGLKMFWL